jgi:hypothetical protein
MAAWFMALFGNMRVCGERIESGNSSDGTKTGNRCVHCGVSPSLLLGWAPSEAIMLQRYCHFSDADVTSLRQFGDNAPAIAR